MIQSGGFLGGLLGPLVRAGLPLMKSVIKNAGIHKKILGSAHNTTLIISNDEMEDILKIVRSLEYLGLLLKEVSETIQNEAKDQRGGFLSMLLGTLGASLLRNMLAGIISRSYKSRLWIQKIFVIKIFDSTASFNKL